ncbi:unnamed protein product [Phaeothamnion confervicola]
MVSKGDTTVKNNSRKVRKIGDVVVGFAGSTADAFTLMDRLERKLEENNGQLTKACVELAKAWRTDKYLRRLEASIVVADATNTFELDGAGNVLEPEHGVLSIGSGGDYAMAAARALMDQPLEAEDIAKRAMHIAADMCVFTNNRFTWEVLEKSAAEAEAAENDDDEEGGVPATVAAADAAATTAEGDSETEAMTEAEAAGGDGAAGGTGDAAAGREEAAAEDTGDDSMKQNGKKKSN